MKSNFIWDFSTSGLIFIKLYLTNMIKLFYLCFGLFLIGFLLKFFHVHYTAVIMLTALVGILIVAVISLFQKDKKVDSILLIAIWSWLVVLLVSIKFFPFGAVMLVLASIFSILAVLKAKKEKQLEKLKLLVICAIAALIFYFTPTQTRFYILNIKWNYEIETDFITLDKYSWFLYKNGQLDEADSISKRALKIAQESGDDFWAELIKKHNQSIKENNWTKFNAH